jgi:hypothetical protein
VKRATAGRMKPSDGASGTGDVPVASVNTTSPSV